MLFKLGGTGGHPFYSTLQLSRFFRCSVGSTSVGCGDISLCRKDCLNRTGLSQAPPLCSIGKAATSMLPPLPPLYFIFQNEYASYTGRSGRASLRSRRLAGRWFFHLQSQPCQKLWPLRALVFEARLLLPCASWKMKMPWWSPSDKLISSRKKIIFQNSAQTAFKSLRLLRRRLDLKSSLRSVITLVFVDYAL